MAKKHHITRAKNGPRAAQKVTAVDGQLIHGTLTGQARALARAIRIQGDSCAIEGETAAQESDRDRRDVALLDLQRSLEQTMSFHVATSASDALAQVLVLSQRVDDLAAYASESKDKYRAERASRAADRMLYSLKRFLASISAVPASELGECQLMPASHDPFHQVSAALASAADASVE